MHAQKSCAVCSNRPVNKEQAPGEVFCPDNCFIVCVQVAKGCVVDAWSTGRMMRNMNLILRDDVDEHGHPCFLRNAHCLCNDGHALAAVRALEDLAGVSLPRSVKLVRSMVQALRCTQEHLLHFYQFYLSNWVCLDKALRADPGKAARLADRSGRAAPYFRQSQAEICTYKAPGNGLGDHPEYRGTDELHLLIYSNSLESLQIQTKLKTALGLLGCKNGTYAAFQMAGLPTDLDLGPGVLQQLRGLLFQCRDFVCTTFLNDLEQVARACLHWKDLGPGIRFLSLGEFVRPHDSGLLFPDGIIGLPEKNQPSSLQIEPVRTDLVREDKKPEWHLPDAKHYGLNFGKKGPVFHLAKGDFHWLSAPRHGNDACEAGSLARIMGGVARNRPAVVKVVNETVKACGMMPKDLNSALGRLLSRGIEAVLLAQSALAWLDELEGLLDSENCNGCQNVRLPESATGTGTVEVPRGALIHTINLEKNRIVRHDYLTPSQWNLSPRDSHGTRGPLEQALLGTPVFDQNFPLEILRVVQGFDPCNACHIVVEDRETGRTTLVKG